MLVLSRRTGESIMIGEDIEVVVAEVEGDKVRLGIKAPRDVEIVRKELVEAVREENTRASQVDTLFVQGLKDIDDQGNS